ncbi:MAG TPA: hypothetical protein DCG57_09760 [Candidatus Riflebacteria bacterium]|nr:hypothetical protein [Candidatus Riflebacteria bacterium]
MNNPYLTKDNPNEAATPLPPAAINRIDNPANGGQFTPAYGRSSLASKGSGDIEKRIRKIYADRYPTDFAMQKTMVEHQTECYRYMQSYHSAQGVPTSVFKEIKSSYVDRYPTDFAMQKTMIEHQAESYLALQKGK